MLHTQHGQCFRRLISFSSHLIGCCTIAQALFSDAVDTDRAARDLQRIMKRRQLAPHEPLFTAGSASEVLVRMALHLCSTKHHTDDCSRAAAGRSSISAGSMPPAAY